MFMFPLICFSQVEVNQEDSDNLTYKFPPVKQGDRTLQSLSCFTGDLESFNYVHSGEVLLNDISPNCTSIYIETDYYTYTQLGSDETAVENWINEILDQVAILYSNEGIDIYVSDIYFPTNSADDWSAGLGISDIFGTFAEIRGDTINGRLKHFMSMRNLGGGIAWVNTLCMSQIQFTNGTYAGPYGVSTSLQLSIPTFPTYSWTVEVVAHELGHNFGSRHTQDCVWGPNTDSRIDDCQPGTCPLIQPVERSTIMSYCHLSGYGIDFTLGFGTLPGNLIRAKVSGSCVSLTEQLVLSGNISGDYLANEILVDHAINVGPVRLTANLVEITNSDIEPTFEIYKLGCNE